MGAAQSCKQVLYYPSEALRWDLEIEDKLMQHDPWLERMLQSLVGMLTWKSSSWSDLASVVDNKQTSLVNGFGDAIDPESSANVKISEIRLIVLVGHYPPAIEGRTGIWAWLDGRARTSISLDHTGHPYGARTVVNTGHPMGAMPPVPSLEQLGLEANFQAMRDREEAAKDSYVIKLRHTYSVTQYDPPRGPFKWQSEMVYLKVVMAAKEVVVLQLTVAEPGSDGLSLVTACSMGGEQVAVVHLNLDSADVDELLAALARRRTCDVRSLRLLFPSGAVTDWKAGATRLSSFVSVERQVCQDSPTSQALRGP